MERPAREEQEIFDELAALCISPGYAHVIAFFSARDSFARINKELTAESFAPLHSESRLIRTEISTLVGLLIRQPVNYSHPGPDIVESYIVRTESLCEELHKSMSAQWFAGFDPNDLTSGKVDPFSHGSFLREPIFYGGDSAYDFQYRDLTQRKYVEDEEWLTAHKGFHMQAAVEVAKAISRLQNENLTRTWRLQRTLSPEQWTMLPGFTLNTREVADCSGVDIDLVQHVLVAFSVPPDERNSEFTALSAFNSANATPRLRQGDQEFILFQSYSLTEALYEAPFYWMGADRAYAPTAFNHRGSFTESFAEARITRVFGSSHVHANVDIWRTRGEKAAEVDVLVLFGDRAIVIQAKAKRLTLEARKGNDNQIRDDFKKAVQDAYDQALKCAQLLASPGCRLTDARGEEINIGTKLKKIFPICLVADHYPALSFQARQFLTYKTTDEIQPPVVMDVFALDAITEMLESPLVFLSYLSRRSQFSEKLMIMHEHTLLAYHLKRNLWVEDGVDFVSLDDGIAADLDVAMTVRRMGVLGIPTVDGVLTRFQGTTVGRMIGQIERQSDPRTIDFGLFVLQLSENATEVLDKMMEKTAESARRDGANHDVSFSVNGLSSGLTIHCNSRPDATAEVQLRNHCKNRKYIQKANSWFGIVINPGDCSIRQIVSLHHLWKQSDSMDKLTRGLPRGTPVEVANIPRVRK